MTEGQIKIFLDLLLGCIFIVFGLNEHIHKRYIGSIISLVLGSMVFFYYFFKFI